MTMLELLDGLVELLRGCELEGAGPLAVEKYRRPDHPSGPVVFVTPVSQGEEPVAIGGQYAERFVVEVAVQAPWGDDRDRMADAALKAVDAVLQRLESNRTVGGARRGRIGEVRYEVAQLGGRSSLVARISVEFTADK